MERQRWYVAIDLKSFYASVECIERGLDPLTTNLVVADSTRTSKTICLAVTPSLKARGISGRARLFEVIQQIEKINAWRKTQANHALIGSSVNDLELTANPKLAVDYITATPRMALYMAYSWRVYQVYLRHIAPEDIHPYSIDEVFIDVTPYLRMAGCTPQELARIMIQDVQEETGITATAGIGTNLYLAKVAMDILAKRQKADTNGVRMAILDEAHYREMMWNHRPIEDFWRIGRGYARKLARHGLYTMGDVARCSLGGTKDYYNEELLYRLFGINAELLIDHAWGLESCTMADIKAYQPNNHSHSVGQVLTRPYAFHEARIVLIEMAEEASLRLVKHRLLCNQVVLTIGYDAKTLEVDDLELSNELELHIDHYGRAVPKHAHGSKSLGDYTASVREMTNAVCAIFDRTVEPRFLIRRITIGCVNVISETQAAQQHIQQSLFSEAAMDMQKSHRVREQQMQEAVLNIKSRFGKNAIFRGISLEEGATGLTRNKQIGGHHA